MSVIHVVKTSCQRHLLSNLAHNLYSKEFIRRKTKKKFFWHRMILYLFFWRLPSFLSLECKIVNGTAAIISVFQSTQLVGGIGRYDAAAISVRGYKISYSVAKADLYLSVNVIKFHPNLFFSPTFFFSRPSMSRTPGRRFEALAQKIWSR